jgi:hypothetical protein
VLLFFPSRSFRVSHTHSHLFSHGSLDLTLLLGSELYASTLEVPVWKS